MQTPIIINKKWTPDNASFSETKKCDIKQLVFLQKNIYPAIKKCLNKKNCFPVKVKSKQSKPSCIFLFHSKFSKRRPHNLILLKNKKK